jgi:HTH-type transcriptional regulator/antitoxin HigA
MSEVANQFRPDYRIHPGEILSEELEARGYPPEICNLAVVKAIMAQRRGVTPVTAQVLGQLLGTSAELWLNLQAQYEEKR